MTTTLCDPNANPLPSDYDPNAIEACSDCGEDFPRRELADTIAGALCPGCEARFTGAARRLTEICAKHARGKAA